MSDTKPPTEKPDPDGVQPSRLCPSLCGSCVFGLTVSEAAPIYSGDDEDVYLRPTHSIVREVSFCNHPMLMSEEGPAVMENVVLQCQAYEMRPLRTTRDAKKPDLTAYWAARDRLERRRRPKRRARKERARRGRQR